MAEFNSCFLSFKLNFNETAAASAPPAVREEIATGGMRAVKDAQTMLLTIDNEIQNANAPLQLSFSVSFKLFFLILFQTFCKKYLGLLFIVRVHLTVTFSAGSHSLNFSGQPLYLSLIHI